jgi:REP element-mobilizing transposase RayT
MARQLRIQFKKALYHIINRGNERRMIFLDEADRIKYLNILHATIARFNWLCHVYCLMGNHYHLMIETPDANLAIGMKYLNQVYSQFFNWKYNRVGQVFQGRYKSYIIQKETYLLHCCRYIILNPWEAKLVGHPGEWKWSSYAATAGLVKPPAFLDSKWVLEIFGSDVNRAREFYIKFIEADMNGKRSRLDYKYQIILGSEEFAVSILKRYGPFSSMKDISNTQLGLGRPSLDQIFNEGSISREMRNQAILKAYREYKFSLKDIANHLNMNPNYLCDILKRLET